MNKSFFNVHLVKISFEKNNDFKFFFLSHFKGKQRRRCDGEWAFERTVGYVLTNFERKKLTTRSREECMESCLDETKFDCRSVNYNPKTGECSLSDMDRHTLPTIHARERYFYNASKDIDYIESNCVRGIH